MYQVNRKPTPCWGDPLPLSMAWGLPQADSSLHLMMHPDRQHCRQQPTHRMQQMEVMELMMVRLSLVWALVLSVKKWKGRRLRCRPRCPGSCSHGLGTSEPAADSRECGLALTSSSGSLCLRDSPHRICVSPMLYPQQVCIDCRVWLQALTESCAVCLVQSGKAYGNAF